MIVELLFLSVCMITTTITVVSQMAPRLAQSFFISGHCFGQQTDSWNISKTTTTTVSQSLYRSTCASRRTPVKNCKEDFVIGAKFYYPHALACGNQCIQIRQKTLEFSSTLLSLHRLCTFSARVITLCEIIRSH